MEAEVEFVYNVLSFVRNYIVTTFKGNTKKTIRIIVMYKPPTLLL